MKPSPPRPSSPLTIGNRLRLLFSVFVAFAVFALFSLQFVGLRFFSFVGGEPPSRKPLRDESTGAELASSVSARLRSGPVVLPLVKMRQQTDSLRQCSRRPAPVFFNSSSRRCEPIADFFVPRDPSFEVSEDELSCRRRGEEDSDEWRLFPFLSLSNDTAVLDHFGIAKSDMHNLVVAADDAPLRPEPLRAAELATLRSLDEPTQEEIAALKGRAPVADGGGGGVGWLQWIKQRLSFARAPAVAAAAARRHLRTHLTPAERQELDQIVAESSSSLPLAIVLERRYSRFFFYSSWIFRQYLPFKPMPRSISSSSSPQFFSSYHAQHEENLFTLENFCVHPTRGLFGFFADDESGKMQQQQRPNIKEDTRLVAHIHWHFAATFSNVKPLPLRLRHNFVFDARPVIFIPCMPQTRHNQGHVFMQFASLISILQIQSFHSADTDSSSSTTKPLLILVWQPTRPYHPGKSAMHADTKRTTVWAFYLRVLGLPFAVMMASGAGGPLESDEYFERLYKLGNHSGAATSSASSSSSQHRLRYRPIDPLQSALHLKHGFDVLGASTVCFRRGVVTASCVDCEPGGHGDKEEYAFANFGWMFGTGKAGGGFAALNLARANMMQSYQRMIASCLLPLPPPSPSSSSILPRVFLVARYSSRGFANFAHLIGGLQRELVDEGFVSEILVREPWSSGSRARYVDEVRSSQIFVAPHGGAVADAVLLNSNGNGGRGVVVEYTPPAGVGWHEIYAAASRSSYHLYVRDQAPGDDDGGGRFLPLPAHVVADHIKVAVCRFFLQQQQQPQQRVSWPNHKLRKFCLRDLKHSAKFKSSFQQHLVNRFLAPSKEEVEEFLSEFGNIVNNKNIDAAALVDKLRAVSDLLLRLTPSTVLRSSMKSSSELLLWADRGGGAGARCGDRSCAVVFFEALVQRFVHVSLRVGEIVERVGGKKRNEIKVAGGKVLLVQDVVCVSEDVCLAVRLMR